MSRPEGTPQRGMTAEERLPMELLRELCRLRRENARLRILLEREQARMQRMLELYAEVLRARVAVAEEGREDGESGMGSE